MTSVIRFFCLSKEQVNSIKEIIPYKKLHYINTLIDDIQFSRILFDQSVDRHIDNRYFRIILRTCDPSIEIIENDRVLRIRYKIYPDGTIEKSHRANRNYRRYY